MHGGDTREQNLHFCIFWPSKPCEYSCRCIEVQVRRMYMYFTCTCRVHVYTSRLESLCRNCVVTHTQPTHTNNHNPVNSKNHFDVCRSLCDRKLAPNSTCSWLLLCRGPLAQTPTCDMMTFCRGAGKTLIKYPHPSTPLPHPAAGPVLMTGQRQ